MNVQFFREAILCLYVLLLLLNAQNMIILNLQTTYHISLIIRWSFFSFQNNPKNLDLSYKMNLDLLDYLGKVKLVL